MLALLTLATPASARRFVIDLPAPPCSVGTSWKQVAACLRKQGKLSVLAGTEHARMMLVRVAPKQPSEARLLVYVRRGAQWQLTHDSPLDSAELLRTSTMPTPVGDALVFEVGSAWIRSPFQGDNVRGAHALRRQVTTTACVPGQHWCAVFTTSCELYLDGKAISSFHAELVWHATLGLRLRGDRRNTGPMCTVPESLVLPVST
jgi:hypothetical protein